jgi:hypothetical protein
MLDVPTPYVLFQKEYFSRYLIREKEQRPYYGCIPKIGKKH